MLAAHLTVGFTVAMTTHQAPGCSAIGLNKEHKGGSSFEKKPQ